MQQVLVLSLKVHVEHLFWKKLKTRREVVSFFLLTLQVAILLLYLLCLNPAWLPSILNNLNQPEIK